MFKPRESAEGDKDSQAGETENIKIKADIPASQFLQFLQQSAEENDCKFFSTQH